MASMIMLAKVKIHITMQFIRI